DLAWLYRAIEATERGSWRALLHRCPVPDLLLFQVLFKSIDVGKLNRIPELDYNGWIIVPGTNWSLSRLADQGRLPNSSLWHRISSAAKPSASPALQRAGKTSAVELLGMLWRIMAF